MVIWNNVNLRDKGIIVEKEPTLSKGKKNIEIIEVEGKSGFYTIDKGTYQSFLVSVECHFDPDNVDIDDIKTFLDGVGTLSFDGNREYVAVIQNSISFEKVLRFKSFLIVSLCNPYCEDKNYTETTITNTPTTLNIADATFEMYPELEITATGNISVTFNNKTFNINNANGTYILDSKLKVITLNNQNASSSMQYDFPVLQPGENTISYIGNITNFKIKYKKAYL